MKTLTLLRHAKSSDTAGSGPDDRAMPDVERPLNAKGARAAETMGRHLRAEGLRFDHLVASPARRVRETLAGVAAGYGDLPAAHWNRDLYLPSLDTLVEVVRALPADADSVLLAGHNPGLEQLVLLLVPDADDALPSRRRDVAEKFPTASLAELRCDVADWAAVAPGGATLVRFVRPRDLDPALGPETV